MKQNELYHSETYLGKDYSDGIRHWKYIKRERRNGRWVYYYSDAEYDKAKKDYYQSKTNKNKSRHSLRTADLYRNSYKSMIEKTVQQRARLKGHGEMTKDEIKIMKSHNDNVTKAAKKYVSAGKKYLSAKKKWKQVQLKTATRRRISMGIVAVANALSKFASKVKKKLKK